MEIPSFNELKHVCGYGVVLQKDLMEVRFELSVVDDGEAEV